MHAQNYNFAPKFAQRGDFQYQNLFFGGENCSDEIFFSEKLEFRGQLQDDTA